MTEAASAGLWPAPREAASTTNTGLMFGGVVGDRARGGLPQANRECLGPSADESGYPGYREATILSGLWRWQDNADSTFYQ